MLEKGDQSTKFFCRVANSHWKTNTIEMLKIDRITCLEVPLIRDHVIDFFEHLLTKQVGWWPKLGLGFEYIETHNASWLEKPFEEIEVHDVIRIIKDKVPSLDNFSMGFFQSCWDVIKDNLMEVFHELFSFVTNLRRVSMPRT